jgi:hypothetical protein
MATVTDAQVEAARRVAPEEVHEALGLVEYVGHDAPKGRERIRRTEDWTSLDVDAVPMIHPSTVSPRC